MAISSDKIADTTNNLINVPLGWKIAIPIVVIMFPAAYMVHTMPGPVAYPADLPIIENPKVPPLWKFRNDLTSYAYVSKDITVMSDRSYYEVILQNAFISIQSQFGLPWGFAIEAKTSGFNSSLGIKKQILNDYPFNLACRTLFTLNPIGFCYSFSVSASKPFNIRRLIISPIVSPTLKYGPAAYKPVLVINDTIPQHFRDNFNPVSQLNSKDLIFDFPLGIELGFRNFAISVYGSYSSFLKNYSQNIDNIADFLTITSYVPKNHFTVGIITSIYRY